MITKYPKCTSKHIRIVSSERINIAIIFDKDGNFLSRKDTPVDFFGWWGNCLDCGAQFDEKDFEDE